MKDSWIALFKDKKRLFLLAGLFLSGFLCTLIFSYFMVWNEGRQGLVLNDPVLSRIVARDLSLYTFLFTNVSIYTGLIITMRRPEGMFYVTVAAILICFMRIFTILSFPLEPPEGIIPLRDFLTEALFYQGSVMQKDLFFSGHTANIILVGLLLDKLWLKRTLMVIAGIVGALLLVQHVHYTIDVLAAPFFAALAYKSSVFIVNRYFLADSDFNLRTGQIFEELGIKSPRTVSKELSH